jgi:hypothetical protein
MIIESKFHLTDRTHRLVVTHWVGEGKRWKQIEGMC